MALIKLLSDFPCCNSELREFQLVAGSQAAQARVPVPQPGSNPAPAERIEGLRMQTVYYSPMRKILAWSMVVAGLCGAREASGQQQSAPMRTSIVDSHEGVTIGVDPWTSAGRYHGKFPKKNPYTGGVLAIHLTIRNDNDEPIRLNRGRIRLVVQLDEDNKQELEPLNADDVADAVLLENHQKDPTIRRSPIPLPTSHAKPTRDKKWEELRDDCQNAALPSPVIAPHSTMEGLVYFDVRSEWDLLENARLYIPDLERMTTKQAILYFDIGFSQESNN